MSVRAFAIVLNSVGGLVLIGGALISFLRDRRRTYNLFLVVGGVLPMVGGSMLGLFGNPDSFFLFELGGTVFLFAGFVLGMRYIVRKEAAKPVPAPLMVAPGSTYQCDHGCYPKPTPISLPSKTTPLLEFISGPLTPWSSAASGNRTRCHFDH